MRNVLLPLLISSTIFSISCSSKSSHAPATFCDTACFRDSVKFSGTHVLKPYVYLSAGNCRADSLTWSISGMGVNKKVGLSDFLNTQVYLNRDYIRCYFKDAEYAWLLFNDCSNGRGYSLKLPFDKNGTIGRKTSNINNIDKKFSIADHLVAYTDRGNIYVEDMGTGKKAMMTFGENLGIDYDALHEYIDSVNISDTRIWVKVKIGKEWKPLEKKITLE